eukprot:c26991_g1_i3 orf=303-869(+)
MNRKPGDWSCVSCQHLNFSWRDSCQRCGDPRPMGGFGGRSEERGDYYRSGPYSYGSGYNSGSGPGGDYGRNYGGNFGFGGSDVRPGDWYCSSSSCGAHNFASRNNCFKCGSFKDAGANGGRRGYDSGGRSSGGSFGFGSSYNTGGGGGRSGFKSGDWICGRSGCNEHNFASRTECFRCQAPRESGTAV